MKSWLTVQLARGACLRLLGTSRDGLCPWLDRRWIWFPQGEPLGRRIGLVSSRLGRRLDTQAAWFTLFRAVCGKFDRRHDLLLTASATTTDRFIAHAAELFDLRVLSLDVPRPQESLADWLRRIRAPAEPAVAAENCGGLTRAFLSPPLQSAEGVQADEALAARPLRDRALVCLSARLLVFHLRRGGHLEALLRRRLADSAWPPASLYVALGAGLVDRDLADELLDLGAVGWLVLDTLPARRAPASEPADLPAPITLPGAAHWPYLTHCTRAQPAGWPDEDPADYARELLLRPGTCDHSAFAGLRRIVVQQRLLATNRVVRGSTPVVSFTAVPLEDLSSLRVFRPHLGRWDFEPYGICVRRDWLMARGARAVRYGDDACWQSLSAEERPFFQLQQTRGERSHRVIDWTVEREWRHVGDLDLSELPADAGLLFVPTAREARQLAPLSRWPITVLSPGASVR